MFLRLYLFTLYAFLFLSFGLLAFILVNFNPFESPPWLVILFYMAFLLFWAAFFGLIGFYFKVWASNREVIFAHLKPTLRQSFFIGIIFSGLLFLYQIKVLNWWMSAIFVVAVLMVEMYFQKR